MLQDFVLEIDDATFRSLQCLAAASGRTIEEMARLVLTNAACLEDPSLLARLDPFAYARGEDENLE